MQNNAQQPLGDQDLAEPKKRRRRRPRRKTPTAKANAKEAQVIATISTLEKQIAEWFEIAPDTMYEGFDLRVRKKIGELID